MSSVMSKSTRPLTSLQQSWRWEHEFWIKERNKAIDSCLDKEYPTAWSLLEELAIARGQIAERAFTPDRQYFGAKRTDDDSARIVGTMIGKKYENFASVLADLVILGEVRDDGRLRNHKYGSWGMAGVAEQAKAIRKGNPDDVFIRHINFDGECYSTIILNKNDSSRCGEIYQLFAVEHAAVDSHAKIIEHIERLYVLLSQTEDKEQKIRIILAMAFHLGHAVIWRRGSAAINEMFIEVLCGKHGIEVHLDKLLVTIDLIAMFSNTPERMLRNLCGLHEYEFFGTSVIAIDVASEVDKPLFSLAEVFPNLANSDSTEYSVEPREYHRLQKLKTIALEEKDRIENTAILYKQTKVEMIDEAIKSNSIEKIEYALQWERNPIFRTGFFNHISTAASRMYDECLTVDAKEEKMSF